MKDQDLERLRADLRRLYLAAHPGPWKANVPSGTRDEVIILEDRDRRVLAMPNFAVDAQLAAAARNALPRLFAEIDSLRASATVPVLGTIEADGVVRWATRVPEAPAA